MKIRLGWFNRYLALGLLTLLLTAACETSKPKNSSEKSKGKEVSTLRLHLEVNADGTDRNGPVPIFREHPVMVNVHKEFFLNEGDVQEAALVETMGGYALMVQFDKHGTLVLDTVTSSARGSRIAIFSQFGTSRWLAAPRIMRRIPDGILTFTPDASREETERIALGLNNVARELKNKPKKQQARRSAE
jgi:hypothetical protein